MNRYLGLLVIVGGLCLVFAGLLIYTGSLSWFGRLPGDIRYESDHVRVYVPIVSMLIVSVVLSVLFYLLRRFF
jgi:membrane protein implicated in regulation of membrane protease activity